MDRVRLRNTQWLALNAKRFGVQIPLTAILALWLSNAHGLPPQVVSFAIETPPPFGYSIGDLVMHKITLSVERPVKLVESLLPQPGRVKNWLELREIRKYNRHGLSNTQYTIELIYQLFKSVEETENLTIPTWNIVLDSDSQRVEIPVPKWDFSYAPLIPQQIADEHVEIRPSMKPEPISMTLQAWVLRGCLFGLALVLMYLAWFYDKLPFFRRHPRPFATAYIQLKKLSKAHPEIDYYHSGFRTLHRAFDETAGKTVFADCLDAFFDVNLAFKALDTDAQLFFEVSRQVFFQEEPVELRKRYSFPWLLDLCKRFRAIEYSL